MGYFGSNFRCGVLVLSVVSMCAHGEADTTNPRSTEQDADGGTILRAGPQSAAGKIAVRHILLFGNRAFEETAFRPLVAPFEGRELSLEDLEDLRLRLTRFYVDAGYINSGAVIPEQRIVDGTLYVRIAEGHLNEVRVSGAHHYRDWFLPQLMDPEPGRALNIGDLQDRMQLLLQDGVVDQVNAELMPGDKPGESILAAMVREGPRFKVFASVDDDRPPNVGETGATLGVSARNIFGINDSGTATFGLTPGYTSYEVQESVPVIVPALSFFVRADKDHGNIVESSIRELGITSRETSVEAGLTEQLIHSLNKNFTASLSSYYTDTTTLLLGVPFSFTPGVVDGRSKVAALRLALDWSYRGADQVYAARTALDLGIDAFGSTQHADSSLPDSNFRVWNGQFQYIRQVWHRSGEAVARAAFQMSSKGLLPSEKFAVGGMNTVRGYETNFLVRDEGAVASAEYRQTVYRLPLPGVSRTPDDGRLALAVFYDAGMANDRYDERTWIASVGGGLRWMPAANCYAVIYKGVPLHRMGSSGSSLEEQGVHFKVSYETGF